MRFPATPPRLSGEEIQQAISLLIAPDVQEYLARMNGEYYHWDELRHRPCPANLTLPQAWWLVKLTRGSRRQSLPFQDEKGRAFSFWLPDRASRTLHEVDRWGGSTLAVAEGTSLALGAMRDRVVINSLMEEAIATSQIEGAATTRTVAKEMLRSNRRPRDRSEQMIVNSYRTIRLLRERLDRPLSLDLLFEIQESMTRETLDDPSGAGRFRTEDENIQVVDLRDNEVLYTPPPAALLGERLGRLVAFANSSDSSSFIHPLVKAAILHFWLAYEHPFVDGNGRTARALLYWFMLKSGYWLFEFLTVSRVINAAPMKYYRSFLHSEHDDNDLTYSVLYQLDATQQALVSLREYLARKQEEQQIMAAALRTYPALNHRQRALLEEALRRPESVFTFQSHQAVNGITLVTARKDILNLVEKGLLTGVGSGRPRREFTAPGNLPEKLALKQGRQKRKQRRGE